jgi:hypothetical protein
MKTRITMRNALAFGLPAVARCAGRLKRLRCALLRNAGHEAGRGNVLTAIVLVALYVGGRLMRVVPAIPQATPVPSLIGLARIGFETWRLRRIAIGLARANARGDANAARRWLARVKGALADLNLAQDRLYPRHRPR